MPRLPWQGRSTYEHAPSFRRNALPRGREALEALYAQLPRLRCQRLCEACCGPIGMSALEWQRLERTTHGLPKAKTTTCPLLRGNTCSASKVRPMICRLWGLLPSMSCPFGCEPERWLTEAKGDQFLPRGRGHFAPPLSDACPQAH